MGVILIKQRLLVPVALDGLRVDTRMDVAAAMADFSRMPWAFKNHDANASNAYLGEGIITPSFADGGHLETGIHLHWALPDALTSSHPVKKKGEADFVFPAAPNIWLLSRWVGNETTPDQSWIIESDYFYPAGDGGTSGSVSYPLEKEFVDAGTPNYRYMGRVLRQSAWPVIGEKYETHRSLKKKPLTALGYGEPSFAAFYPNCRSVFGFCDTDAPQGGQAITYRLAGWHRETEDDFCSPTNLALVLGDRLDDPDAKGLKTKCTSANGRGLEQVFGWRIDETCKEVPDQCLYVAEMTIPGLVGDAAPHEKANVAVAIGNTGTEALSAFLAGLQAAPAAEVEDQLEALHLLGEMDHLRIDTGAKFQEARHSRGFMAVPGGTLWHVSRPPKPGLKADVSVPDVEITLDDALGHDLNELNTLQRTADRLADLLTDQRKIAFADWYKYMLSAYPPEGEAELFRDIDLARFLLSEHVFPAILKLEENFGDAQKRVQSAHDALAFALTNTTVDDAQAPELKAISAARYWQSNEPVIMLAGRDAKPTDRHGNKDGLECAIFNGETGPLHLQSSGVMDAVKTYFAHRKVGDPGKRQLLENPWTPFLMEWETEVWPLVKQGSDEATLAGTLAPDHVTAQYKMHHNAVDLTCEDGDVDTKTEVAVYKGRSLLTPQAKPMLVGQMDVYFDTHLFRFFRATCAHWPGKLTATTSKKNIRAAFKALSYSERRDLRWLDETGMNEDDKAPTDEAHCDAWYDTSGAQSCDNFLLNLMTFYDQIHEDFHVLTQALTGFNAAHLGQRATTQLPIDDPLAFPDQDGLSDYGIFAELTNAAVLRQNHTAPEPMYGFSPIRGGTMRMLSLRLVDTFGRHRSVDKKQLHKCAVSRTLHASDTSKADGHIVLPPRFIDPVRLGFRWLSSDHGQGTADVSKREDIEANSHPATTPICGWLLPNNLDDSLSVYNTVGEPLGYIDLNGDWRLPPGGGGVARDQIANPHLAQVVEWISAVRPGDPTILTHMMSAMDSALENVDPAEWAAHESMALLMGRPIAVARLAASLEMQGSPSLNPGWGPYNEALQTGHDPKRHSAMVESVVFRMRLGEHAQLNDGLIGFWKETVITGGYRLSDTFFAPQADSDSEPLKEAGKTVFMAPHDKDQKDGIGEDYRLNVDLQANAPAKRFTVLFDPRGRLHASLGIVPTKSINIPPDQYAQALRDIEISFLAAPTLTPRIVSGDALDPVEMPLPPVPGYEWSWTEKRTDDDSSDDQWPETKRLVPVTKTADLNRKSELRDGYLVLRKQPPPPPEKSS